MNLILEATKMLAINFAEWLSKNQWQKRFKTHPNKVGMYWSDYVCEYKTIEQLYDMFLEYEKKIINSK